MLVLGRSQALEGVLYAAGAVDLVFDETPARPRLSLRCACTGWPVHALCLLNLLLSYRRKYAVWNSSFSTQRRECKDSNAESLRLCMSSSARRAGGGHVPGAGHLRAAGRAAELPLAACSPALPGAGAAAACSCRGASAPDTMC